MDWKTSSPALAADVTVEGLAKSVDPLRADIEPGSHVVTAEKLEEFRTIVQRLDDGDAVDAAAAPLPHARRR